MPQKFNWHTDEDFDWDGLPPEPGEQPAGTPRRWPVLVILTALLLGTGAVIARQVQQRAAANTSAMRADVISSHNLIALADNEQDVELFISLLSGRDSNWTTAQQDLFAEGLLRDRAPFGLSIQAAQTPLISTEEYDINFAPDLLSAELVTGVPYSVQIGNGLTETVTLQETAVYRLGQERWLRSPPDPEFWGQPSSQRGTKISLTYPERDTALVARLLPDLEQKLGELCNQIAGLNCPPALQVELIFSSDPATLAAAAAPLAIGQAAETLQITLPTPTLVGVPLDDAGYQALFRGYAAQISTAIIARQVGYTCCEGSPLFQALVDYQLSQINLRPWPVGEAEYARVVAEQVRLQDLASLWNSSNATELSGEGGWRIYTAVDYFLSTNPGLTAADIQRELTEQETFFGWLNALLAEPDDRQEVSPYSHLMRDWWMRGYAVTQDSQQGDSTAFPMQDLYLTCVVQSEFDEDVQIATLYQGDPLAETWVNVYETGSFLLVSPLPGDDALMQQEFRFDDQRWNTDIRREDEVIPLFANPADYTVSFGQTDPSGQQLAAFTFPADNNRATIVAFDLQNCTAEGCSNHPLPGIPIWSPNGERALFTIDPDTQLALLQTELRTVLFNQRALTPTMDLYVGTRSDLLDGAPINNIADLTRVAHGHAPFWLDDDTIGYLSLGEGRLGRTNTIVTLPLVGESAPQPLAALDDFLAHLDTGTDNSRMWWLHYVMVHPDQPDRLVVVVLDAGQRNAHVFSYHLASKNITHLMSAGYGANHSVGISPDARYIVLTGVDSGDIDQGEENAYIQVYDLASQKAMPFLSLAADFPPFSTYDWSADGRWLALMLEENLVGVYAPEENFLRFLDTPPGACAAPAWIDG